MGMKFLAHSSRAPSSDDPVHAPVGQEQVTVRIDVADVAPQLVYFLCADALDPARVFSGNGSTSARPTLSR